MPNYITALFYYKQEFVVHSQELQYMTHWTHILTQKLVLALFTCNREYVEVKQDKQQRHYVHQSNRYNPSYVK